MDSEGGDGDDTGRGSGEGLRAAVRSRRTIARREIASLTAEKTILLALMIQLFIAAFSSFLVVGLVSLYDPGASSTEAGVEFGVVGNGTEAILPVLADEPDWRYETYGEVNASLDAFRRNEVDGVLSVTEVGDGSFNVTAVAPRGSFRTTLIVTQIKDVLERFEERTREQMMDRLERRPLPVPPDRRSTPYFGFTYTVLIPLLMFLPVFISGSIVSDSLTEEFDRGTIELLRAAPLSDAAIVEGKMLAMTAIAPLQAGLWLGLLALNGTAIANPIAILGLVTGVAIAVVGVGAAIGVIFRDRRQAQFVYSTGVIAAFGLASLLPESPANTVALLAVGSATPVTVPMIAVYWAVAVVTYLAVRRVVGGGAVA